MKDLKVDAIQWLQDRLFQAKNPYESKLYETALEYATAPKSIRKVGKYYKEGLLRDARRKLQRDRDLCYYFDNEATEYLLTSDFPSQEFDVQYLELETALMNGVDSIHKEAKYITSMLKEGYSTKEIADTVELSESYVRRIISSIKEVTQSICLN